MNSPISAYKELSQITNIKELAYYNLFTKYIERNLVNEKKMNELGSTNQEGIMLKKNGGFPLPGFIYTFINQPDKNDMGQITVKGKTKEYSDYIPLVFCTSVIGTKSFKGLNLNMFPPLERVKFFEIYYQTYKKFFENIEKTTENEELALNEKFISLMSSPIGKQIVQVMSLKASGNFTFGYRTYNFDRINRFRMIEYTEWDYIPHYEPKDAFKEMNQKQIQELYYKTK